MKLREALKASPTGYAKRFDIQRQATLFRTRNQEFVQVGQSLVPTSRLDGGDDWEPVLADDQDS